MTSLSVVLALLAASAGSALPDASVPPADAAASDAGVTQDDDAGAAQADATGAKRRRPNLGQPESFAVGGSVAISLRTPEGWSSKPLKPQAVPDLTQIQGASVQLARAWSPAWSNENTPPTHSIWLICASAPSLQWSPGLETVVFERLNSIANAQLEERLNLDTLHAGEIEKKPPTFEQSYRGHGKVGRTRTEGAVRLLEEDRLGAGIPMRAQGRHVLGFSSDQVLVCSAACVEPAAHHLCASVIETVSLSGQLAAEPEPSVFGRLLVGFSQRPVTVVGVVAGVVLALAGAAVMLRGLLLRRPARRKSPAA